MKKQNHINPFLCLLALIGFGANRVGGHGDEEHSVTGPEAAMAVSQSANIRLVGHLDPFAGNQRYADVWGDGHYAYLGSFLDESVGIIDIENPSEPRLVGTYKATGRGVFEDIQVKNGVGYFASWHYSAANASGVHIVDVSDPANPVLLKRLSSADNGFNSVHNVFLYRNFLYEAEADPNRLSVTVKVFDVANPATPIFIRDIRTSDTRAIHDITVVNDRLYTSGWGGKTEIYDVANIVTTPPKLLGSVSTGEATHSSWVNATGDILATCSEASAKDLRLYNIADPKNPMLLAKITGATLRIDAITPHNPVIVGDLLFVSWYQAGLQVFNIRNPSKPVLVGSYDTYPGGISAPGQIDGYDGNWGVFPLQGLGKILLSDWDNGLFIVDATKLGGPDVDGDLLPDAWEVDHGLNPDSADDASLDSDNDGLSNLDEFRTGTNPHDSSAAVRVLQIERINANNRVSFSGADGHLYRIERNSRVSASGWVTLKDEVKCTNGVGSVIHTNGAASGVQFYRVIARP